MSFKLLSIILTFFMISLVRMNTVHSQNSSDEYMEKVKTLDGTLETLYSVISGEKGQERDWDLFKFLFTPEAKLIPTRKNNEGFFRASYLSPDAYIVRSGKWLVENGFFEKEIHRIENTFGNITQVFSTYESYRSASDEEPFARGINSIQLLNDGERWWLINIYWTGESEENPIPNIYLPK